MRTSTATPTVPRPLRAAELAVFRRMLEQQQHFRREQLAELAHGRGPLGSADDEIGATLAAGASAALRDVQAALRRMDDGRYGRCTGCAAPLARERLEILPQVDTCMRCGYDAKLARHAAPSGASSPE